MGLNSLFSLMLKGGPTSGNKGHDGIPGHLGGSKAKLTSELKSDVTWYLGRIEGKLPSASELGTTDYKISKVKGYLESIKVIEGKKLTPLGKAIIGKGDSPHTREFLFREVNDLTKPEVLAAILYSDRAGASTKNINRISDELNISNKTLLRVAKKAESKGYLAINQIADLNNISFSDTYKPEDFINKL